MEEKQNSKKMRKRNILRGSLIALAAVMLLCGSYLVTLAYLQEDTVKLDNTFFPAGLATTLQIVEKDPVDTNGNGIFDDDLTGTEVTSETYLFAPGVTLKKQPYVKITGLTENAYLFISYTDTIHGNETTNKELPWEIDTANWKQITDSTHKRLVYVYVGPHAASKNGTSLGILTGTAKGTNYTAVDGKMDIIKNDTVRVIPEAYDITNSKTSDYSTSALTFSAYLVQAIGFADYQAAWNATYGK